MPQIHLVEGPVGAGKTTFVTELGKTQGAPRLVLDDWFVNLFSPDRPAEGLLPWYIARKERCLSQIWKIASEVIDTGHDVVLELGLVEKASRQRFYELVAAAGYRLTVYALDAPRDVRRERVRARNRDKGPTYAMEVPDAFFEMASDRWEPFDAEEIASQNVRVICTT